MAAILPSHDDLLRSKILCAFSECHAPIATGTSTYNGDNHLVCYRYILVYLHTAGDKVSD